MNAIIMNNSFDNFGSDKKNLHSLLAGHATLKNGDQLSEMKGLDYAPISSSRNSMEGNANYISRFQANNTLNSI